MAKKIYKEKQTFDDRTILVILAVLGIICLASGILCLFDASTSIYHSIALIVVAAIIASYTVYLKRLSLKLSITKNGIKFAMPPKYPSKQFLPWSEIESCRIVETSKAAQWSGGNISYKNEKNISVTGRNGLEVNTIDGESYFIGCKDVAALRKALEGRELK